MIVWVKDIDDETDSSPFPSVMLDSYFFNIG